MEDTGKKMLCSKRREQTKGKTGGLIDNPTGMTEKKRGKERTVLHGKEEGKEVEELLTLRQTTKRQKGKSRGKELGKQPEPKSSRARLSRKVSTNKNVQRQSSDAQKPGLKKEGAKTTKKEEEREKQKRPERGL